MIARMNDEPARLQAVRSVNDEITRALMAPFAEEEIEDRKVGGNRTAFYVAGENIIRRLIQATGNRYDVEIKSLERQDAPKVDQKTGEIKQRELWIARVAVTVPGLGTREHIGVQMVEEGSGEDIIKGVITDAVKKAATLFGVGLELYDDPKPGSNQNTSGRQDRRGDGTDLTTWRERVKQALAVEDPNLWQEVIKAAGKDPSKDTWRWIEIVAQLPTLDRLERFSHFAADQGMLTSAVESKIANRKKDLGRSQGR